MTRQFTRRVAIVTGGSDGIGRQTSEQLAAHGAHVAILARDMAKRADAQLPRFFKTLPRKPYGVAAVPDAIAPKYTTGRYIGTSKESTDPGYYWVNTYDLSSRTLYTLPALTVHEAVPGHHLQISLNQELGDSIPKFRKNLYLSAYGEGWGLYTEFLAEDMGMYTTPYEKFGQLTYEMWRACRLVVDTGIHAKGWTRERVVSYMAAHTALSMHEIETETDRYISWPGQALSCGRRVKDHRKIVSSENLPCRPGSSTVRRAFAMNSRSAPPRAVGPKHSRSRCRQRKQTAP